MLDGMRLEIRHAIRALARRPGFTLAAVLTLGLGIGATSTLYALINAVLFKPPAHVADPGRIVSIFTSDYSGPLYGRSSFPDIEEFRKLAQFSGVTALLPGVAMVGDNENPIRVGADVISSDYFTVLQTRPQRGALSAGAASEGVVISAALSRRLGTATTVRVNGAVFPIAGVVPAGFTGIIRGRAVDLWVPIELAERIGLANPDDRSNRGGRGFFAYARLAPGVTLAQANDAAARLAATMLQTYPQHWTDNSRTGRRITVLPEKHTRIPPQSRGPILGFGTMLFVTVVLVLLVCCSNVAGLMLARVTGRARELAIRASLGASGTRIMRQIMTESVLLALVGGAVGTLAALWLSDWILTLPMPTPIPLSLDASPDYRLLAFTAGVTGITALLFGLLPAIRMRRPDLTSVLKGDVLVMRLGSGRRITLRELLVSAQLTFSLLLLIGSVLFVRSVQSARGLTPGFPTDGITLIDLSSRPGVQSGVDPAAAMRMVEGIKALPGVEAVTFANDVPLALEFNRRGIGVEGYDARPGEEMEFGFNLVGPEYFTTMRLPLKAGRDFAATDKAGAPGVAIVNETFARRFFGNENPLGKRITFDRVNWHEIVGVAQDSKYQSLAEDAQPYFYTPALQEMWGMTLHVRSAVTPALLQPAVNAIVGAASADWAAVNARSFDSHISRSLLPQRIASSVLGLFGALATVLAAIGLYASVALWVTNRTRDFGVRLALGAARADLLRAVFARGSRMVAIGLVLGVLGGFVAGRLLSFLLVGIQPFDPVAFVSAPLILAAIAALAIMIPAWRITRLDPLGALRSE